MIPSAEGEQHHNRAEEEQPALPKLKMFQCNPPSCRFGVFTWASLRLGKYIPVLFM